MLSTPAPIPISIIPELIAFAISTHACRPEEHCLFKLLTEAETGKPATRAAARNSVAPPPGGKTEPTAISSTSAGSILERSMSDLNAPTRRSAAAVSLNPPLPPLVNAVRRHAVTTTWAGSDMFWPCHVQANLHRQGSFEEASPAQTSYLLLWEKSCSWNQQGGQRLV
jgi:hypothetical protein